MCDKLKATISEKKLQVVSHCPTLYSFCLTTFRMRLKVVRQLQTPSVQQLQCPILELTLVQLIGQVP